MMPNRSHEEEDSHRLAAIREKFAQGITAGRIVSLEAFLDEVPASLRDALLEELLTFELQHRHRSGVTSNVEQSPASSQDDAHAQTIVHSDQDNSIPHTVVYEGVSGTASTARAFDTIYPRYPDGKGYVVEQEIDRGGMGVVLKVRDEHLQRSLALKVIRGQEGTDSSSRANVDQALVARFVREAQITGRLDHPGVVPIHELATDREGRLYFTMKYVQGQTLSKVIQELRSDGSPGLLTRVLEVVVRVCETLAFAHSKGVIHRDLKPANIMVGQFGEAYVMDWGLAKIINESDLSGSSPAVPRQPDGSNMETMYGLAVGTPFYMPPEQAAGRIDELDERTDVYSVGTLLYEILTGQCPYRGDGRSGSQVVQEVLQGPPTPIRELDKKAPPELVAIAEKAMKRRKEDRYGSVADLADDLRAFLSQRVVSAYQTGAVAKLKKWIARNQSLTIVGLLTLATIVGALAIVTLLQYRNQTQMADKNRELNSTLAAKDTAIEDARIASEKERRARDEVNGLSLMSHSKNVRAAGDATLASLLALESVARFPRVMTLEALYAAAAEMVDAVEFDVTADTTDLAWSPDEKRLLAVHIDGTGTVWDVDTKQAVATIVNSLERRFLKCSFSRDGQEILTAGAEGTVALWDANTGVRTLALAVGFEKERPSGGYSSRPNIVAAAFGRDKETGERDALIVAASEDRAVFLFDRRTGRELTILEPPPGDSTGAFTKMRISPDGRVIVVGCADGRVYLWNDARQLVRAIQAHEQPIQNIEFSPDGKRFITCGFAIDGNAALSPARCWDTESGNLDSEIAPGGLHVCCAAVHPTKPVMALGVGDRTLCLWDLTEQRVLDMSAPQHDVIRQLDFAESGARIVSVTGDDGLMTWLVQDDGRKLRLTPADRLLGHRGRIRRAAYNRSGSRVASAANREIRISDTGSQNVVPAFGSPSSEYLVRVTRKGDRIFEANVSQKRGRLWSYPIVDLISEMDLPGDLHGIDLTGDDLHIVASFKDGTCRLWNARTGTFECEVHCTTPGNTFGCDGNRLCIANDSEATVWDWSSGKKLHEFGDSNLGTFRASHDGRSILAHRIGRANGTVTRIDPASGAMVEVAKSETCHPGYFSRSGRYFDCHGPSDPNSSIPFSTHVKLIDLQTNQVLFSTKIGESLVRNVFVNHSDTLLLVDRVSDPEHVAEIYSIPEGKLIRRFGPANGEVTGWSGDLRFVSTISNVEGTQLWEAAKGALMAKLDLRGSKCTTVRFSPDNRYFAVQLSKDVEGSGAKSNQVALWNAEQMKVIAVLPGENACDFSTSFLPDGEKLWTMTGDHQIRLWPLDIVASVKKHVSRPMTMEEQRMYGVDENRQVPTEMPPELPSRTAQWNRLSTRIRLLSPITPERRALARKLIGDVDRWLSTQATPEEIYHSLKAVDQLRVGLYDTDPLALAAIAELHGKYGEQARSVELLELAARHPRAHELQDKLTQERAKIAPRIVSLRSADALVDAAFEQSATPETKARFIQSQRWALEHSPHVANYLTARQHRFEGRTEQARLILQRLADKSSIHWSEIGPELSLQLAECELELGHADAAAVVLRSALNEERFRAPEVWNRWLQISFSNLGLTPEQLLAQLPEKTRGTAPEPRHEDWVAWLLDQLSRSQPIRINCGGDRYVAADGAVWESDRFFTHGHAYFGTAGEAAVFGNRITNTADSLLYQSERWFSNDRRDKPAGYQIPVPNGAYSVTLGFAEIYAAERSFDVLIEGTAVLTAYDPARGEWATAEDFTTQTIVKDGQLDITLNSRNSQTAKISCLRIVPVRTSSPD